MKLRKIFIGALSVPAILAMVACGGTKDTSAEAKAKINDTFSQTTVVNKTVQLTYNLNYEVTVDANGGKSDFSSFKHKIVATETVEYDPADNYLYMKKVWQDQLTTTPATTTELLLYKDSDGKYYTVGTYYDKIESPASEVTLANVNQAISSMTKEKVGSIDLSTLIYNSTDKAYELKWFGQTTTFTKDEMNDPTYSTNENGGVNISYAPDYVGYETDAGTSDFGKASGQSAAAQIEMVTDDSGFITSMTENYTAGLDFNIMTPAPTVGITGSRSFTATYGATLTKKSDLSHPESTVSYGTASNGTFTVKDLEGQNYTSMTDIANGGKITKSGHYIVVKPTANDGYEVDKVTVNGEETKIVVSGMYCFSPSYGVNEVVVTFKAATPTPSTKTLLYTYEGSATNGTVMDINLYDDGTFTVTCPGYGGAKAGDGTYTKSGMVITATSTNMQYFTVKSTTITLTIASDFKTMTGTFFNGEDITFTYKANS